MTTNNDTEITECLKTLVSTTDGTYFMHESFNRNNYKFYTRSWFAWVNTLFGEFIVKLWKEKPHIL